jgi:hypothetical protein
LLNLFNALFMKRIMIFLFVVVIGLAAHAQDGGRMPVRTSDVATAITPATAVLPLKSGGGGAAQPKTIAALPMKPGVAAPVQQSGALKPAAVKALTTGSKVPVRLTSSARVSAN